MGIFVDYMPLKQYNQLLEKKEEKLDKDVNYLIEPLVKKRNRLRLQTKNGDEISKFYTDNFSFNPYLEPRECAIWARDRVGEDCWIAMFQMGGHPPYRKLFKGLVKKIGENNYEIKYFCKMEHDDEEEQKFDGKVIEMSKSNKKYRKVAGL